MYLDYAVNLPGTLLQGDIIKEYPFCYFPRKNEYIIVEQSGSGLSLNQLNSEFHYSNDRGSEEQLIVNSRLTNIMLLSQSCDMQSREIIIIAPVYTVEFFSENLAREGNTEEQIRGKILTLKNIKFERQFGYYYYLPASDDFLESYVDFNFIQSIPRDNISIDNRALSLSDHSRHWLAYKLNNFFGRPVEFENL